MSCEPYGNWTIFPVMSAFQTAKCRLYTSFFNVYTITRLCFAPGLNGKLL